MSRPYGHLVLQRPQSTQSSILPMRPCHSSDRKPSEGVRRMSCIMRAQLLICIPTVHGAQYPQPRQNSPERSFRSSSINAAISAVMLTSLSKKLSHSASSESLCMPQSGSTLYWLMNAMHASLFVRSPPQSPFMAR